jgi:proline iminopeptidase
VTDRYPPIEPHASGLLEVGDGHQIYWETVGNPDGLPALWLHGGPGSGASLGSRRLFDPSAYRAVLFDQRGSGRSLPLADHSGVDLTTNTTAHLLRDIEHLRAHLGIDRWVVTGGSWGVALALAYAQAHPERVIAMALAAVTSGTRRETDWITRDMRRVFPREWDTFTAAIPEPDRNGDLSAARNAQTMAVSTGCAEKINVATQRCRAQVAHVLDSYGDLEYVVGGNSGRVGREQREQKKCG